MFDLLVKSVIETETHQQCYTLNIIRIC